MADRYANETRPRNPDVRLDLERFEFQPRNPLVRPSSSSTTKTNFLPGRVFSAGLLAAGIGPHGPSYRGSTQVRLGSRRPKDARRPTGLARVIRDYRASRTNSVEAQRRMAEHARGVSLRGSPKVHARYPEGSQRSRTLSLDPRSASKIEGCEFKLLSAPRGLGAENKSALNRR
ncbi:hypothetical protein KM043_006238 [Ampulex compressa]|nr:hypothetical protein KM043_006238 [Ampulex compressa]